MIQKKIASVVLCGLCGGLTSSVFPGAVRSLVAQPSVRNNALMVVQQALSRPCFDVQKMREEKLKDMSAALLKRVCSELGKHVRWEMGEQHISCVDLNCQATVLYPGLHEQIKRMHREYFEILKAYCDSSYSRDFASEKQLVELFVPQFVEKILERVRSRKAVGE